MSPRARWGDGVSILSVFVLLLVGVPSRYVVGPLGGAGSPSQILGMGLAIWWVGHRFARPFPTSPVVQPIRRGILLFGATVLVSYVAATVRPIEEVELQAADRALLTLCAWIGLVCVAADEIPSQARLDTLLRRLVLAGGALATLGLAQFQTGMSFTNYLRLPGLTESSDLTSITTRNGYLRPAGTALHAIEFGVVISMLLPLALHYALTDSHRSRMRRWFPVAAIGLAIPISVSRSAVVCTVVALVVMLPVLSQQTRRLVYLCSACLLGLVYLLVPGILGTIAGLFTGIAQDGSALSRTDSYDVAGQFIARAPVFGRGFATFLPSYRILDNQYLLILIELGIVGLLVVLFLFATAIWTAARTRRQARDQSARQLAQALAASIAAGACSFALFDAFSFPLVSGVMFLLIGVTASLRRLQLARAADTAALASSTGSTRTPSGPAIPLPRR